MILLQPYEYSAKNFFCEFGPAKMTLRRKSTHRSKQILYTYKYNRLDYIEQLHTFVLR